MSCIDAMNGTLAIIYKIINVITHTDTSIAIVHNTEYIYTLMNNNRYWYICKVSTVNADHEKCHMSLTCNRLLADHRYSYCYI